MALNPITLSVLLLDSTAKVVEGRLSTNIDDYSQQFGNLCQDVNDHKKHLTDLSSELQKQESLLKGYKEKNDTLVVTLNTDFNDACAKIPELFREHQDSTPGLVTSIKTLKSIVQEIRAQAATGHHVAHQVNQGTNASVPPSLHQGSPVKPPPMLVHACTTRFQTTDGLSPTF
jgi:hypothetical protein